MCSLEIKVVIFRAIHRYTAIMAALIKYILIGFTFLLPYIALAQNLFPVPIGGKYGYIDTSGRVVIKPSFEQEAEFVNGFALVKEKDLEVKVIDTFGQVIFTFTNPNSNYWIYEHSFSDGLLAVYDIIQKRYGFIDNKGKWVIKPKFYEVTEFTNGLAGAWKDPDIHVDTWSDCGTPVPHPKWGYIDRKGNYVISDTFYEVSTFLNGYAIANKSFLDATGRIIPDNLINDEHQLYRKAQYNWHLVYGDENIWVPANDENFENCKIMFEDKKLDRHGFKDYRGNIVVEPKYKGAQFFSEGYAGVQVSDGKWGYINCSGELVIEPEYQFVYFFSEGLAAVQKHFQWGFIDNSGKLIIPFQYDERRKFKNGLVKVKKLGKTVYLNKRGEVVWKED
jgi:hypothetical protein